MRIAALSSQSPVRDARRAFLATALLVPLAAILLVSFGLAALATALAALTLLALLLIWLDRTLVDHHPYPRFGWANRITLFRAAIVAMLAARLIDPSPPGTAERWVLASAALLALALDAADGLIARRQHLTSAFGARFDIEIDAFATLTLAALAIRTGDAPTWTVAIGLMRYVFLAAGWALPVLRAGLPAGRFARRRRQIIGAGQGLVLTAVLMPAMPVTTARFACAAALLLLIYSFVADAAILLAGDRPSRRLAARGDVERTV
jgi:phosphatidylglycerophosphate synthase